ncbi:MAG: hypothetical protein ACLR5Y_03445 [Haemophilus parainfluenzae]
MEEVIEGLDSGKYRVQKN